ncbi:hypothetical protein EDM56_02565 [Brevibacillus fluminis]|uniref:Uncharacterized protein n=1 Tax=Brevibacillus fluminis TaxID=511487 RepID=A0A3M8DU79_9BACL|nr:hypothetical protein [Brevibacillus fluminis]RNB91656.1 hypothetical protein EDM56_02565 [Brevibacillus fluminis]
MAKAGKKIKKKDPAAVERSKRNMKIVTSQTCAACKQQCQRGLNYLEKMSKPGAIGYGVPCILTRGK